MEVSSLLSVFRNSVVEYFGNLYVRGEKIKVGKGGVFTHFSWKRGMFSYFFLLLRVLVPVLFQTNLEWPFFLSWPISVME